MGRARIGEAVAAELRPVAEAEVDGGCRPSVAKGDDKGRQVRLLGQHGVVDRKVNRVVDVQRIAARRTPDQQKGLVQGLDLRHEIRRCNAVGVQVGGDVNR